MRYSIVEIILLSYDAEDCKHYTLFSKFIKALWRRAEDCVLNVIGLNEPCIVDKLECTKLPVINCTYKSRERDHAQGWY